MPLPEQILCLARLGKEEAAAEMLPLSPLKPVREGRVVCGKAAELLGVMQTDYQACMSTHQVSPFLMSTR